AAAASIRRVAGETTDRLRCAALLPAYAEIMIVAGELDEARRACEELEATAVGCESEMLRAMHATTVGAVELAEGDPADALVSLRRAAQGWNELEAPYEAARARMLVGRACRELGDEDAFALELDAAKSAFVELGAKLVDPRDAAATLPVLRSQCKPPHRQEESWRQQQRQSKGSSRASSSSTRS